MNILSPIFLHSILILLSFLGILVCLYIIVQKRRAKKISCPLRGSCERVLSSSTSKLFGISIERFGLLYYVLVLSVHLLYFFSPIAESPLYLYVHFLLSLSAMLFSLYLVFVQSVILRAWCTWCLLSVLLSVSIMGILSFGYDRTILFILDAHLWLSNSIYIIILSLGFGASLVREFTLYKYIKNNYISEEEKQTVGLLSEVVLVSIILIMSISILSLLVQIHAILWIRIVLVLLLFVSSSIIDNHIITPSGVYRDSKNNLFYTKIVLGLNIFFWFMLFGLGFF